MNDRETRTLVRAGLTLVVAAGVRWGVERARPTPTVRGATSELATLDSAARAAAELEARASRPLAPGERIDPNRADATELRRLPGVGPAVARAVVASREEEGPYRRPEDLARVRGVGAATVEKLRPHLDFTRPPTGSPLLRRSAAAGAASGRRPPDHVSLLDPPAAQSEGEALDPNRAGVAELQQLPGIGPALAGRIVASRDRDGPFRTADDLLRVRGIGPVLLARIRSRIRVGGE